MEIETTYTKDDMDYIHDAVFGASRYCPGEVGWIARQMTDGKWTDDYAFVIGKESATVTIAEARNPGEALHIELAGRILGYSVDSKQDLQRRKTITDEKITECYEKIQSLQKWLVHYEKCKLELQAKLDALG